MMKWGILNIVIIPFIDVDEDKGKRSFTIGFSNQ